MTASLEFLPENPRVHHLSVANEAKELPITKVKLITHLIVLHVEHDNLVVLRLVRLVGQIGILRLVGLPGRVLRQIKLREIVLVIAILLQWIILVTVVEQVSLG